MPIKKDGTGKRWVEMEVIVPGSPEQIWQAMATGAGNSAWFTKTTIEEKMGGKIVFDFGPSMTSAGEVTMWQPPHRFGYVEREWNGNAPPCATEITITARAGDKCLVRMVHSLFSSTDDWDDQMEGFEGGWPGFFEVLKIYVAHYAGMQAASFMVTSQVEQELSAVWTRLSTALGIAGANAGESRVLAPEGVSARVERVNQDAKLRWMVLHLQQPTPGVAVVGSYTVGAAVTVTIARYSYGDAVPATVAALEQRWRAWLGATFPSRAPPPQC
jgi:uncharacterized protein YndB with AHSA1/START domain